MYYPIIPKCVEVYAFCTIAEDGEDIVKDNVHLNHTYKVLAFTNEEPFFPYGIRLQDFNGNELKNTFYLQRFHIWEIGLN